MSPVDLGNSPHKLGVMFNGYNSSGMVDASTPSPNVIGWASRMVLVSCG
jgi:hypothetical protein